MCLSGKNKFLESIFYLAEEFYSTSVWILKVDERAVLKYFDWPEGKVDALREASFEYRDLKKLQSEVSAFEDKPGLPCDAALLEILKCLEK